MLGGLSRRDAVVLISLLLLAALILTAGWKLLWFLTDDAYISFRYVSNSMMGHGYVWNPAPFRPVEGYTNFLWVLLLDGVWRLTGTPPPAAANYLSLAFSYLTLVVVSLMVVGTRWKGGNGRPRMVFLGLVLLGITTNRTFLTWSSSGLETAMFGFFVLLWVGACLRGSLSGRWSILPVTLPAAAIYLTRPDGILFLAATILIVLLELRRGGWKPRLLVGAAPLVLVPVHLAWRRLTYGEWLPNSYYAKVTGVWPESGLR
jgi:arabinofuranosyltransferase